MFCTLNVFIRCESGKNEHSEIPTMVLNEEKFTQLLVDFALAESASNLNIKNVSAQKMDSVYAFNPLTENKVTKATYDSTISFYSKHPALYKKIYENVLTKLSKMQVKKDSVRVNIPSK